MTRDMRATAGANVALRVDRVSKSYGATRALVDVSLTVAPGEIRALLGENGAGKSTLIKILTGLVQPDSGSVGRGSAVGSGVVAVHQELTLVPTLSVAENLVLGRPPTRGPLVDYRSMATQGREALQRVGLDVDPRTHVEDLGLAERQLVEIARALRSDPSVLLLDEPTSSLNASEAHLLFDFVRDLARRGTAVLFVSHRLDEVYALCESATILRDGRVVGDTRLADAEPGSLTRLMLGARLMDQILEAPSGAGARHDPREMAASCDALTGDGFSSVSLHVAAGEVLGLAGLAGAGQASFARALGGLQRVTSGTLRVGMGVVRCNDPASTVRAGIVYVPADRAIEGLCLDLSSGWNASLPSLRSLARLGFLRRRGVRARERRVVEEFDVRPADPSMRVGDLSGGNQQKIVIGKWMVTDPPVIVLDDPTRGVDVGAKFAIHELIRQRLDQGQAIIMVSSDVTELVSLAHRVVVFRDGVVSTTLSHEGLDEASLIAAMSGVASETR